MGKANKYNDKVKRNNNVYKVLFIIVMLIFFLGLLHGVHSYFDGVNAGTYYDEKIYGWIAFEKGIYWYFVFLLPLTFVTVLFTIIFIIYDINFTLKNIKLETKVIKIYYLLLLMMIVPVILYIVFYNKVMLIYKVNIICVTLLLIYGRIKYHNNKSLIRMSKYLLIEIIIITIMIIYLFML